MFTRIFILPFLVLFIGLQMVTHVFAAYTETALITGNEFMPGTYKFQLSTTDSNADGIADGSNSFWSTIPVAVWKSPDAWAPGQKFSKTIFVRSGGTIDIPTLRVKIKRNGGVGDPVEEHIRLTKAWYDANANGVLDEGEDLLPEYVSMADADGNSKVTLQELATFSPTGITIDLEKTGRVLPGSLTNAIIGGYTGTGKGVTFEWELMGTIPPSYGGSKVNIDFEFYSHHLE